MGVLDDAIRQHLELKRQRGADPGEVKREEDEALGKVVTTRGATAAQADDPEASEAQSLTQEQESTVHQPTAAFDPAEVAGALGQLPAEAVQEPEAAPETEAEPEPEVETVTEPEPKPEVEIVTEPEPEPIAEPQHDEDIESDPPEPDEGPVPSTQEPVAEDDLPEDAVPEDDADHDELEDTPEFLEDAPEHDKLWFEQKPPKDFDF